MDILELIPQRPPMIMIERLISCEGSVAKGMLKINEDNVFLQNGLLTESGMIEALAQTAAARTGWISRSIHGVDNPEIPVGVIGSLKDFRLFFHPMSGDEMETEIEVIHEFMNASVVAGLVKVNGEIACKAEMRIFLTGDHMHQPS